MCIYLYIYIFAVASPDLDSISQSLKVLMQTVHGLNWLDSAALDQLGRLSAEEQVDIIKGLVNNVKIQDKSAYVLKKVEARSQQSGINDADARIKIQTIISGLEKIMGYGIDLPAKNDLLGRQRKLQISGAGHQRTRRILGNITTRLLLARADAKESLRQAGWDTNGRGGS